MITIKITMRKLQLIAHLDDLCVYHWLFVLNIVASFQQRDGYSNVLRKLQVLLDQLDEARWIKKNIEKRSRKVSYI